MFCFTLYKNLSSFNLSCTVYLNDNFNTCWKWIGRSISVSFPLTPRHRPNIEQRRPVLTNLIEATFVSSEFLAHLGIEEHCKRRKEYVYACSPSTAFTYGDQPVSLQEPSGSRTIALSVALETEHARFRL